MKKPIRIATSPMTNTIYAGTVLKDGRTWGAGKCAVTDDACVAVAQHVLAHGEPVIISATGKPLYEITVRDLTR